MPAGIVPSKSETTKLVVILVVFALLERIELARRQPLPGPQIVLECLAGRGFFLGFAQCVRNEMLPPFRKNI